MWRKHGGVTLFSCGTHRTHKETLQQRHRLLCKAQRPAGCWGLDGWLQVACLHGVEHPHGSKYRPRCLLNKGRSVDTCSYLALRGEGYCCNHIQHSKNWRKSSELVNAQYRALSQTCFLCVSFVVCSGAVTQTYNLTGARCFRFMHFLRRSH